MSYTYLTAQQLAEKNPVPRSSTIPNQSEGQCQMVVNPTDVTPLAAHSETSQSYVLPLVAKHLQRKEHLLTWSSFSESI